MQFAVASKPGNGLIYYSTTKQDSPALSFFHEDEADRLLGHGTQWVLWMPRGIYDTSVEGDSKFLGWHLNNASVFNPTPTDFVEMMVHQTAYRRPDVLRRLVSTHDTGLALDLAESLWVQEGIAGRIPIDTATPPAPTTTELAGVPVVPSDSATQPWTQDFQPPLLPGGDLNTLALQFDPAIANRITDVQLYVGTVPHGEPIAIDAAGSVAFQGFEGSGDQTLSIQINGAAGNDRFLHLPARFPAEPPAQARLDILTVGIEQSNHPSVGSVDLAEADAEELAGFLRRHILKRTDEEFTDLEVPEPTKLTGPNATAANIRLAIDTIKKDVLDRAAQRTLRDDVVAIVIETHLLNPVHGDEIHPDGAVLVGFDGKGPNSPDKPLTAYEVTEMLADIAETGATVFLFLDVVHRHLPGSGLGTNITNWVRDLQGRGIVVVLAAGEQPSLAAGDYRAMASGFVGDDSHLLDGNQTITFDTFRERLIDEVKRVSKTQVPAFYVPPLISDLYVRPLLDPTPSARE